MSRNSLYHAFGLVRILLYPLALLYGAIVWLRNRLYNSGFFSSVSFSTPVIVVGNLSVGGTGKTPHVEYLIRLLKDRYQVATMSRGYKRHTQGFLLADENTNALRIGDEPMQYHLAFPDIAVSVAEERMTGIPALLQKRPDIEVVLLDDAFQHRSVKPGFAVLITDFSKPFYEDYILPYGTLRESRKAYRRADLIVVSKCPPGLTEAQATAIRNRIQPEAHQQVVFSTIAYGVPYELFRNEPVSLQNKNVLLVTGIAKPAPLQAYVDGQASGSHLLAYPDHHYFVTKDLEEIATTLADWQVGEKLMVTTEKDAARLMLHAERLQQEGWQVAVIPIQVQFLFGGESVFDTVILNYVAREVAENRLAFGLEDPAESLPDYYP
ncbi:MAG: tetraacyldisaccharide 4'-kinase [Sphingobacteriales bacterium]|nr:MAG: tetraacyldisaccharide 4'-kinase [Sphingobacteriales bacterium]